MHVHPATVEPRPFLNVDIKIHNGSVAIPIPRSFRVQLKLRTSDGTVHLSSALTPRAATLSALDRTHAYSVGERPGSGIWHTGESEDGDEVDGLIWSSNNGDVKISYDDENVSSTGSPQLALQSYRILTEHMLTFSIQCSRLTPTLLCDFCPHPGPTP